MTNSQVVALGYRRTADKDNPSERECSEALHPSSKDSKTIHARSGEKY